MLLLLLLLLFDAYRGREEQCLSFLEGMPMWGQLALRWGGARSSLIIWGVSSYNSPRNGRVPSDVPSQSLLIWGMWYTVNRPGFSGQSSVPWGWSTVNTSKALICPPEPLPLPGGHLQRRNSEEGLHSLYRQTPQIRGGNCPISLLRIQP